MNNKYYNTSYMIKQNIKKYYSIHKYMFLFLLVLFLVALITVIFTGIKGSADISINIIHDTTLIKYFKRESGPFSFFITRVVKYLLAILFIFFCGKTKFCTVILSVFIAFMSYSLGLNSAVFIILFGLGGTINAVFVIIPIKTCVLVIYIIMSCLAIKNSYIIKKYGSCCFDGCTLLKWGWFLLVLVFLTICETIFINLFSSAFIFKF